MQKMNQKPLQEKAKRRLSCLFAQGSRVETFHAGVAEHEWLIAGGKVNIELKKMRLFTEDASNCSVTLAQPSSRISHAGFETNAGNANQ